MVTYLKNALLATLAGSLVGSAVGALIGQFLEPDPSLGRWGGTTVAVALYGSLIAFPVVLIYGVPLYVLAKRMNSATWLSAIGFGALPGIVWSWWTHETLYNPIICLGTAVAVCFHHFMRKSAANKRFQPTGLASGSAGG